MFKEFKAEEWLPSHENVMFLVKPSIPLTEKPIIQVYQYGDNTENSIAVLSSIKQIHYSEMANLVTLISTKPFNGYVVIK